jgi:hypothetical protein
VFAVVHRVELVQIQKLGQLASIDAVTLIPAFNRAFLRGYDACDVRLQQIV